jgi:hypothetical protein
MTPDIVAQSYTDPEFDLSISNLGRLDLPLRYGSLTLEALYGRMISCNPQEVVSGVVTVGGRMRFTMTFTDMTMAQHDAERIVELAMQRLALATDW